MATTDRHARLLAEIRADLGAHINDGDAAYVRAVKRLVPRGARDPLREGLTSALRPVAERKLRQLATRTPLRLNLGSGFAPVPGWVNIDLAGAPVDVPWNLKRGVPFADGTVDAVFSEHVFEHIPLAGAHALAADAVRALRPGGIFRVAVPDAGALLRSYAGTDDETWALSRSTRMQSVMSLFYGNGHTTMYDEELLTTFCELAGLTDVRVRAYRESALGDAVPDSEHRREGTLYVEGAKPPG
jgi:predicted SAM-dependent methyltransferase